ncbi:MAG: BlaI/MecI/CopY family transcriptional regulator [Planctomycetaceae bacterium]
MNTVSVSDAELRILQLLWERGKLTARQVTQELYPRQTVSDIATVQKLVQRLEQKELVGRDRSTFAHSLFPLVTHDDFAAQRMAEAAAKYAHGSLKPLLMHLLDSDQLSSEELEDIRKMLDVHRKKRRKEIRDDNTTH